ncbi:MAG: hypothetical protein J4F34_00265 [Gemmatimonadetes bacterium]|nr:hypothetical protein [Gemmatimonadota bacterium]
MVVDCQRAIARFSAGLLALLVVVGAGCGKEVIDDCDVEDPPPECNQCPTTLGFMPEDTVLVGDTVRVNVTDFFQEADSGDVLVYTAASSDESTVEVNMAGSALTYIGVDGGEADIKVTATDTFECAAEQEFEVVVMYPNRAPTCTWSLPPPPYTFPVGLSGEIDVPCADPDGDPLTITAVSSDPDVFAVSVAGDQLAFEALAVGTSELTVTATDPEGLSGEAIADIIVVEGEG